ncbi:hypothetical protein HAX54_024096 [Datura stramonium]|uniref:Cytochrome P450 n=1 Tax=Datura stramonium TaxID=4076 RepID=A0ABS8UYK7_DATST|nr:hypothetical protein [Datura stramonium]
MKVNLNTGCNEAALIVLEKGVVVQKATIPTAICRTGRRLSETLEPNATMHALLLLAKLSNALKAESPVKESAYELLFHRAMGFAPYGEYWRNLRRISATHLFSPKRIACFGDFRREIGTRMVTEIASLMETDGHVMVKRVLHFGSLNNVMRTVFGKSYDFNEKRWASWSIW